jgi:RNA-splicing ligase RtcB
MDIYSANKDRSVRSWAPELDENAREQALRSARSPAVAGDIALMPDAHFGMGATVGSVIPTESAIIPAAVGVDIGCGMIATELDLEASALPDSLDPLLHSISRSIPAGFNRHKDATTPAASWMNVNPVPDKSRVPAKPLRKAADQLGTLGGGNHFVEVCLDERERVWAVLHSGSRGIGNVMARGHIAAATSLCKDLDRALDDRDLAYFLDTDPGFMSYIADMLWAQAYALENREQMMNVLIKDIGHAVGRPVTELRRINCHHNYTARETHDGRDLWITRKGAIRAGANDWGVIPGSMGAASFIVGGLDNPASYRSASHGAGRRHGRKEAKRRFSVDAFAEAMDAAGRTWQSSSAEQLLDESPMAYKDIDEVMAAHADLVEIQHRLEAVVNYKGV